MNRILILCGGTLAAGLFINGLVHAAPDQSGAGLYSAAQAKRGADLYQSQMCAVCHGAELVGGTSPALTGADFLAKYTDKSVQVMFDKVQTTMPQTNPGSLTAAQTADLLAYMLSLNKYPAGDAELPADPSRLKEIQLPKLAKQ